MDLKRLDALLDQALDLPAGKRHAFARSALADEPEMLDRFLGLLDAADPGETRDDFATGSPMREDLLEAA